MSVLSENIKFIKVIPGINIIGERKHMNCSIFEIQEYCTGMHMSAEVRRHIQEYKSIVTLTVDSLLFNCLLINVCMFINVHVS